MNEIENDAPIMALRKFQELLAVSRTTVFRFRQRKWLRTVVIAGKPYVTRAAVQDFVSRAEAGQFSITGSQSQTSAVSKRKKHTSQ